MDQYIGKMLDNRYELLELIGHGGMANVYKAKCHRLNRLVAVKILKSDLAENEDFRRRFRDESLAVAQLSHANIVSVYDVSSSDGIEYIVMELIDGITLKQYMERRGQLDWREALHFISQIMRGLSHAHSRGIVHRDIKPQNIMVLRDGSVKVADFGIACLADAANTMTQEALGSVHYISPEQARGDRTDARSDIYSAGVVLYEMLTGRLPFEGDSAVSVAIQHLSSTPLDPREINADIPESLELICKKAMSPELFRRYASADEMSEDLEKFRKDPTVDMEYIRQSLTVSVDDEPTMAVNTTEVATAVKTHEEKKARQEERKEKKTTAMFVGGFVAILAIIVVIFAAIFNGFGGGNNNDSYEVPSVLGLTVEEAQELESVKDIFTIEVVGTRTVDGYEAGQIVEQDPTEGHIRKSNLIIQVYTCTEAEKLPMPSLVGYGYQDAKLELQAMDIKLDIVPLYESSNVAAKDLIISTEPESGTPLKKGDTVTLHISTGPEKVTVISFIGMDVNSATMKAESLGLTVGQNRYRNSWEEVGTVIEQSIEPTTEVKGGDTIIFTISGDQPSVTAQTTEKTISFPIPTDMKGEDSIRVTFLQDGVMVGMPVTCSGKDEAVNCTFTGTVGTTSTVYAAFNGKPYGEQEITF